MPDRTDRAKELRANIWMAVLLVAVAGAAFVVTLGVRSGWFAGQHEQVDPTTPLDEPHRVFIVESEDASNEDLGDVASALSDRLYAVGLTRLHVEVDGEQIVIRVPLANLDDATMPDLEQVLVSQGPMTIAPVVDDADDAQQTVESEDGPLALGSEAVGHDVVWALRLQALDDAWTLAVDLDVNVDNPWPGLVEEACNGEEPRIAVLLDEVVIVVADLRTRQCREAQTLAPQFGSFEESEARRLAGILTRPDLRVPVDLVDVYDS